VEKRRRVAFLGNDVARRLFSNMPAVGETIRIGGLSFEVIGVLAQKAQLSSYFWPDSMSVFVPYTTVKQLFNQDYIDVWSTRERRLSRTWRSQVGLGARRVRPAGRATRSTPVPRLRNRRRMAGG
jgi:putative ABC transport system permease protein